MADSALGDLTVVDFSESASGAWCSRMLADMGATVVLVEPPGGHPLRREPPLDADGRSIAASLFLANKQSVVLDLESEAGREKLRALVRRCGVAISSRRPSELARLGLRYADFASEALVLAHVTPYGTVGQRAEEPANELTVAALSGWASINGDATSYPLRPSGHQVAFCAGTAAFAAVVGAISHRDRHPGEGQEVDVAELDVMISAFSPGLLRSVYTGSAMPRRDSADLMGGPVPVEDGHFALTLSRAHFWRDAMTVLGLHDLAEDPKWGPTWYRAQHKEEYVERVQEAMAGWKKSDLFDELAARRVVAGPVLTMEELRANAHLNERGFWVEADGAVYPGAPFKMSATPWSLRSGAPEPGEHSFEVAE
jgi:crotonobetainyl-CoA:carnitine CoA-transferase CaiB-like acyl-CoA transferase